MPVLLALTQAPVLVSTPSRKPSLSVSSLLGLVPRANSSPFIEPSLSLSSRLSLVPSLSESSSPGSRSRATSTSSGRPSESLLSVFGSEPVWFASTKGRSGFSTPSRRLSLSESSLLGSVPVSVALVQTPVLVSYPSRRLSSSESSSLGLVPALCSSRLVEKSLSSSSSPSRIMSPSESSLLGFRPLRFSKTSVSPSPSESSLGGISNTTNPEKPGSELLPPTPPRERQRKVCEVASAVKLPRTWRNPPRFISMPVL